MFLFALCTLISLNTRSEEILILFNITSFSFTSTASFSKHCGLARGTNFQHNIKVDFAQKRDSNLYCHLLIQHTHCCTAVPGSTNRTGNLASIIVKSTVGVCKMFKIFVLSQLRWHYARTSEHKPSWHTTLGFHTSR